MYYKTLINQCFNKKKLLQSCKKNPCPSKRNYPHNQIYINCLLNSKNKKPRR